MIDEHDIERLKEIFISRRECQNNLDAIERSVTQEKLDVAVIKAQLKEITWILTAVGGGIITMLIKMFFGG